MNAPFQRTKLTVILLGIAQTVLGVMCFLHPTGATSTLVMMAGWLLIFVGAGTLCVCIMGSSDGGGGDLVVGGIELALGTLMVIRPGFFVTYLFMLLGIMVLITGLNDLGEARRAQAEGFAVNTGMGIATVVVGALMLLAPFLFADLAAIIAGIALALSGITEVISGFNMP